MAGRRLSQAQAKAAKQKKLVIVLAVVFVGVAAIQGPKLMKQLHPKAAVDAAATSGSVPSSSGAGATVAAVASGTLHNFSHLKYKDPFKALVKEPVSDTSGTAPAAGAPKQQAPATTPKPTPTPKPVQAAVTGEVPFTAKQAPNAAIVKTNGKRQLVYVGDGFPTADPLFRLVALGPKTIRVGVLGGTFTSGLPTIKLARGKPVTLANQADGSRYVIQLVRLATAAPKPAAPAASAAAGAAPATTTPAATPTPAAPATTTPTTTTAAASP